MDVEKPTEKMEIDEIDPAASTSDSVRKQQQILAKNAVPSVAISLHPLVLMNIAEHWTRIRAQEGSAQAVYGALIGKQDGRKIEVYNSFELRYETIDGDVVINRDYYNTKEEQCKFQTFMYFHLVLISGSF
jgi:COP9 signalosome complex subunit 6